MGTSIELTALIQEVQRERKKPKAIQRERDETGRARKRRIRLLGMARYFLRELKKGDVQAEAQGASAYDRDRDLIVHLRPACTRELGRGADGTHAASKDSRADEGETGNDGRKRGGTWRMDGGTGFSGCS